MTLYYLHERPKINEEDAGFRLQAAGCRKKRKTNIEH